MYFVFILYLCTASFCFTFLLAIFKNIEISISGHQVEIFYKSEFDVRYINFLCESVIYNHDFDDMLSITSKERIIHPSTYSLSYDRRR